MAYEPTDEGGESDLRRRAAWLLAMLVVVAILIVVVMTTLLNTDKGSSGGDGGTGLGPNAITSTGPPTDSPGSATTSRVSTAPAASSPSGTPSTASSTSKPGTATCPTSAPCALDSDVGNAVAAINAFRAGLGKPAVPGSVSDAAKQCALKRGSGCSGGWAETEIPAPADGTTAVKKISQFAKLTDPQMKAVEVGWAFDPASKTYYFATIRKD